MKHFIIVFVFVVSQGNKGAAAPSQTSNEIFTGLVSAVQSVEQFELDWTIEYPVHRSKSIEGSSYECHGWYDFVNKQMRVEFNITQPSNSSMTGRRIFCYRNGVFKIFHGERTVCDQLEGDWSLRSVDATGTLFELGGDPRILGILPEQISLAKNHRLEGWLNTSRDMNKLSLKKL